MIGPLDLERRYDGPIPDEYRPSPSLESQERAILQIIRERRAEHRDVMRLWRNQIARHEFAWAERSLSLAKATREAIHAHARTLRLIRQRMAQMADRAAARVAAE